MLRNGLVALALGACTATPPGPASGLRPGPGPVLLPSEPSTTPPEPFIRQSVEFGEARLSLGSSAVALAAAPRTTRFLVLAHPYVFVVDATANKVLHEWRQPCFNGVAGAWTSNGASVLIVCNSENQKSQVVRASPQGRPLWRSEVDGRVHSIASFGDRILLGTESSAQGSATKSGLWAGGVRTGRFRLVQPGMHAEDIGFFDEGTAVVLDDRGSVFRVDLDTRRTTRFDHGHSVRVAPQSRVAVVSRSDGLVVYHRTLTKPAALGKTPVSARKSEDEPGQFRVRGLSSDGVFLLLSAAMKGTHEVWKRSGKQLRRIARLRSDGGMAGLSWDGKRVATFGLYNDVVRFRSAVDPDARWTAHDARIGALAASADGKRIASVDVSGRLFVWDRQRGKVLHTSKPFGILGFGNQSLRWSALNALTLYNRGRRVRLDVDTGVSREDRNPFPRGTIQAGGTSLVVLPNGGARLWQLGQAPKLLVGVLDPICKQATASLTGAVACTNGESLAVWNRLGRQLLHVKSDSSIRALALSTDGRRVVSLHADPATVPPAPSERIEVRDLRTGQLRSTTLLPRRNDLVGDSILLSPTARRVGIIGRSASTGRAELRLFDLEKRQAPAVFGKNMTVARFLSDTEVLVAAYATPVIWTVP